MLREIVIDSGRRLHLLSNDLDSATEPIGELYKARWLIELSVRRFEEGSRRGAGGFDGLV
jgi:hypothetical protein